METWSAELSRFGGRERGRTARDGGDTPAGTRPLRSRRVRRSLRAHTLELPLHRRLLERSYQLSHRRKRCVAILSRRLLQRPVLGPRPRLLRKLLRRKGPRRRRQLLSVHRADVGAIRYTRHLPIILV